MQIRLLPTGPRQVPDPAADGLQSARSQRVPATRSAAGLALWEVSVKDYDPIMSFGEDVAKMYDDEQRGDENAAVAFLERLAGGGPALELAIGTGRVALPLAARGVPVQGIDISPAMVARLRRKAGGEQIPVTLGDFSEVAVPGTFRLIYVVFNTLFNLLTQEEQVRCFENVAAHLTDDGAFVVETFVPTFLTRLRDDQYVDAEAVRVDEVRL